MSRTPSQGSIKFTLWSLGLWSPIGKNAIKFYKPYEKVNADAYHKTLRYKANYPEGNYGRTQDGDPAHTV